MNDLNYFHQHITFFNKSYKVIYDYKRNISFLDIFPMLTFAGTLFLQSKGLFTIQQVIQVSETHFVRIEYYLDLMFLV